MDLIWGSFCHRYRGYNSVSPCHPSQQSPCCWTALSVAISRRILRLALLLPGVILYETIRALEYNPFDIWNMSARSLAHSHSRIAVILWEIRVWLCAPLVPRLLLLNNAKKGKFPLCSGSAHSLGTTDIKAIQPWGSCWFAGVHGHQLLLHFSALYIATSNTQWGKSWKLGALLSVHCGQSPIEVHGRFAWIKNSVKTG